MKKRIKFGLIGILLVLGSLLMMVGCKLNMSVEDVKDKYGLTVSVTYFANGGYFNGKQEKTTATLWGVDGSLALNVPCDDQSLNDNSVTVNKGSLVVARPQYDFAGWYEAIVDNDGNPQYDEKGNILMKEAMDFEERLRAGDELYLCAKWNTREKLEIRVLADFTFVAYAEVFVDGEQQKDNNGVLKLENREVKQGDLLSMKPYENGTVALSNTSAPSYASAATFVAYYQQTSTGYELISETELLAITPNGTGENRVVYAKYIEGKWGVLRSKGDVTDLFKDREQQGSFYLLRDIDCEGASVLPFKSFGGTIEGNGHKISNLNVGNTYSQDNEVASAFGTLKASARFNAVTFENWTVAFDFDPNRCSFISAYYFASNVENGATFKDVTMTGGSLTIKVGASAAISNVKDKENPTAETSFIFGGVAADDDFLAANTGLKMPVKPTLSVVLN